MRWTSQFNLFFTWCHHCQLFQQNVCSKCISKVSLFNQLYCSYHEIQQNYEFQIWNCQGEHLFPLYKNQIHPFFYSASPLSTLPTKCVLQMHIKGEFIHSIVLFTLWNWNWNSKLQSMLIDTSWSTSWQYSIFGTGYFWEGRLFIYPFCKSNCKLTKNKI